MGQTEVGKQQLQGSVDMKIRPDEEPLKKLVESINELLSDERFLGIRDALSEPNIFNILLNARYEIRHSNFIAWLLDADGTHNVGTLFSSRIIPLLAPAAENRTQRWSVVREKDHIDLLLVSGDETIAVENKTFSQDHSGQLARYRKTVTDKYPNSKNSFVYLTLHGERPVDGDEAEYWCLCSYPDIFKELKSILSLHPGLIEDKAQIYINDYISSVEIYTTKTHQINSDAKEIVAERKYKLMEIFSNLDCLKNIDSAQRTALAFIKDNSSFTRGNGFFRQKHFFYKAFKAALEKHEFIVNERNNSTYLGFSAKNMEGWYSAPELTKTTGMALRFYEQTSTLQFGFGIGPESEHNVVLREKLRARIPKIQYEFGNNAVNSRGKNHIGLFSKKIKFDPLTCTEENVEQVVEKLIKTQVVGEANHIQSVIKRILAL